MQTRRTNIVYPVLIFAALHYCGAHASEEMATKTATTGAKAMLGNAIEGLATAGPYVSVAIQAYNLGKEIKKHTYPNDEEKAHAEAVAEGFLFLTTENELKKCFVDHKGNGERNSFGRPAACEDVAKMLNMLGGRSEVDRMTTNFNQACNLLAKGQL